MTARMACSDKWSTTLYNYYQKLSSHGKSASLPDTLDTSVHQIKLPGLLSLQPDQSVDEVISFMKDGNQDFALVRSSYQSIQGILSREVAQKAIENTPECGVPPKVVELMDRNICIEPDSATLLEVIERITIGGCPCAVIVDSTLGDPIGILSPKELLRYLPELLLVEDSVEKKAKGAGTSLSLFPRFAFA